jgi:dihydroneopterin aldolase
VTSDRILLEGMVLFGRHGTIPEEQVLGQRFVVDVELRLDLAPAGRSDDLTRSVDYSAVAYRARELVEGAPVALTETLAERIADSVLGEHALVESVRVKVTKPNVRLDTIVLSGSSVEITRSRS